MTWILFLIFIYLVLDKIFPDDNRRNGNDVFIPFDDYSNNDHMDGAPKNDDSFDS
jgi:hypothetical protein